VKTEIEGGEKVNLNPRNRKNEEPMGAIRRTITNLKTHKGKGRGEIGPPRRDSVDSRKGKKHKGMGSAKDEKKGEGNKEEGE